MKKPEYNKNKKCPVCRQLLKKYHYEEIGEFLYQCNDCRYTVHFMYPFLEYAIKEFHVKINFISKIKDKKFLARRSNMLKLGEELKNRICQKDLIKKDKKV